MRQWNQTRQGEQRKTAIETCEKVPIRLATISFVLGSVVLGSENQLGGCEFQHLLRIVANWVRLRLRPTELLHTHNARSCEWNWRDGLWSIRRLCVHFGLVPSFIWFHSLSLRNRCSLRDSMKLQLTYYTYIRSFEHAFPSGNRTIACLFGWEDEHLVASVCAHSTPKTTWDMCVGVRMCRCCLATVYCFSIDEVFCRQNLNRRREFFQNLSIHRR